MFDFFITYWMLCSKTWDMIPLGFYAAGICAGTVGRTTFNRLFDRTPPTPTNIIICATLLSSGAAFVFWWFALPVVVYWLIKPVAYVVRDAVKTLYQTVNWFVIAPIRTRWPKRAVAIPCAEVVSSTPVPTATITISRRWYWFLVAMTVIAAFNGWCRVLREWGRL